MKKIYVIIIVCFLGVVLFGAIYKEPVIEGTEESSETVSDQTEHVFKKYDFDNLPELKEKLQNMWQGQECMEKIITPVLVAAMKNKPQKGIHEEKEEVKSGNMPTFIYNF